MRISQPTICDLTFFHVVLSIGGSQSINLIQNQLCFFGILFIQRSQNPSDRYSDTENGRDRSYTAAVRSLFLRKARSRSDPRRRPDGTSDLPCEPVQVSFSLTYAYYISCYNRRGEERSVCKQAFRDDFL